MQLRERAYVVENRVEETREFESARREDAARKLGWQIDKIAKLVSSAKHSYVKWMESEKMEPQLKNVEALLREATSIARASTRMIGAKIKK